MDLASPKSMITVLLSTNSNSERRLGAYTCIPNFDNIYHAQLLSCTNNIFLII